MKQWGGGCRLSPLVSRLPRHTPVPTAAVRLVVVRCSPTAFNSYRPHSSALFRTVRSVQVQPRSLGASERGSSRTMSSAETTRSTASLACSSRSRTPRPAELALVTDLSTGEATITGFVVSRLHPGGTITSTPATRQNPSTSSSPTPSTASSGTPSTTTNATGWPTPAATATPRVRNEIPTVLPPEQWRNSRRDRLERAAWPEDSFDEVWSSSVRCPRPNRRRRSGSPVWGGEGW